VAQKQNSYAPTGEKSMIISCPECSTRFRVDDHKIPAQGAKIRCARCKHIFTVTPATPEQTPPADEIRNETFNEPAPPATDTADKTSAITDDFGFDDFDEPAHNGTHDDFDPSVFDEDPPATDEEEFSFGDEYGNVSFESPAEETEADPLDSFGDVKPFSFGDQEPPRASDPDEFTFSPQPTPGEHSGDQGDPAFNASNDFPMPPAGDALSYPAGPGSKEVAGATSSRSFLSILLLFLLLVILTAAAGAGYLIWQGKAAELEQIISRLTGQKVNQEQPGVIRPTNLQGSFMTNQQEGEIFVIRGTAINEYREARAAIQVKGVIYDKNGKALLQKTIFCGNPISDDDLRKLPYSKMEEIMGNQFGASLANLNVTTGQSIPFTIVFRNLPKSLSEFVVEVVDSKPVTK
jgi:predicted Zn finger-like uncharacterized protein